MMKHYGKEVATDAVPAIIKDHQSVGFDLVTLQIINRQIEGMNIIAHKTSERQTQSELMRT